MIEILNTIDSVVWGPAMIALLLSKTSCDHAPVTFFLNSIRIEISAGCPAELLASLVSILKSYA